MISLYPWQATVWQQLLRRLAALPNAILLAGVAGTGKLVLAQAFAQAVLCRQPTSRGACGECASCVRFLSGSHLGFRLLMPEEGKDSIAIDSVRQLGEYLFASSHIDTRKIVVIAPAEQLTAAAANALLKILEEPPSASHFLLVAHNLHRLPATVRSRCQITHIPLPDPQQAIAWLAGQGVAEGELLLDLARGAPLAAAELAHQQDTRRRFLEALDQIKRRGVLAVADEVKDFPLASVILWLHQWVHDLLRAKLAGEIAYNRDFRENLGAKSRHAEIGKLLHLDRLLISTRRHLGHPLNSGYLLEELLLAYEAL